MQLRSVNYSCFGKNTKTTILTLNYNSTQDTLISAPFLENVVIKRSKVKPLQATLYPNPASSILTIQLHTPLNGQLSIYNLIGRKVYSLSLRGSTTLIPSF